MTLLKELHHILEEAQEIAGVAAPGAFEAVYRSPTAGENLLVCGDNLTLMKTLLRDGYAGKIKLIYIDPPFYTRANYDALIKLNSDCVKEALPIKLYAYHDTWTGGMADYLLMLCARLLLMRELLAEDGCFWIHLDWHAVHYVKIMLDAIFGENRFVNEVIWHYKSGGTSKRHFARKHDTLLFYTKGSRYLFKPQTEKSYNRGLKPYRFKGVKEYKDDLGWYTLVNMKDVWQLDMVGRTAAERTGYSTQKPVKLLERILESCTEEGDLCADFFGGSGTLASAANALNRRWISCDNGRPAFACAGKRLLAEKADFVAMEPAEEQNRAGGKAVFDVKLEPVPLSDKKRLRIELLSYALPPGGLPRDDADRKAVRKALRQDSLALVDYWSVDFGAGTGAHVPEQIFHIGKDRGAVCEKIGDGFESVGLRVVDVFGNSTVQRVAPLLEE